MTTSLERKPLITEGPILKTLLLLAGPIILNNLVLTLYNLTDATWIGHLSSAAFSSTVFVWPVTFLFLGFGMGVQVSGTSLLSRFIGAGQYKNANDYAFHLVLLALGVAIVLSSLAYLLAPLVLNWMGAGDELLSMSLDYLRTIALGFPFSFLYFTFISIMHSQGNTMIPTIISGFTAILNVFLDPLFIFETIPYINIPGLNMGVKGAALATIFCQFINIVVGAIYLFKTKGLIDLRLHGSINSRIFRDIIRIGAPATAGQSGSAFGFIVLNGVIRSYGVSTLGAFGMVNRITDLIMLPSMGIGMALTSMVGQNLGAGRLDRAKSAFRQAALTGFIIAAIGSIFIKIYDLQILQLFLKANDDPKLIEEALVYISFSVFTIPLMALFSVFQGLFQGSGHTRYSMMMSVFRLWVIRLPLIQILKYTTNIGSTGIWVAMTVSNVIIILYGYSMYRSGKWQKSIIKGDV